MGKLSVGVTLASLVNGNQLLILKMPTEHMIKSCYQTFKNMSSKIHVQVYDTENPKTREQLNSVDPEEAAHDEPPLLDIRCLPIQHFSFLVLLD